MLRSASARAWGLYREVPISVGGPTRPQAGPSAHERSVRDAARVAPDDGERQLFRRRVADAHVFLKLGLRRLVARIVFWNGLWRLRHHRVPRSIYVAVASAAIARPVGTLLAQRLTSLVFSPGGAKWTAR